jgi:ATP-dependent Clp protease adaptor protein ClpS
MGTEFRRGAVSPAIKTEKKSNVQRPSKYRVLLLNDDYTPMDFVIIVLQQFFAMSYPHAVKVMLDIHHKGYAVCGVYTRDIAETKVAQVNQFASNNEHPLLCKMEKNGTE